MRRLPRLHPVAINASSLLGVQVTLSLTSLVTVPYLTRVLGPELWGVWVVSESVHALLVTVVDYGFAYSASREVSQHRHSDSRIAEVVAGVLGAKLLLAMIAGSLAVVAGLVVPILRAHPEYLATAAFSALVSSMIPWWYYQGTERLGLPSVISVVTRVGATVAVFLLVSDQGDGWRVFAIQGFGGLVFLMCTYFDMYRRVAWVRPDRSTISKVLSDGRILFLDLLSRTLYTSMNALILSLLATPAVVGLYGGAEKLVRVIRQTVEAFSRAVYPRMSTLVASNPQRALEIRGRLIRLSVSSGAAVGLLAIVLAPFATKWVLGEGFSESVAAVRILALAVPVFTLGNVLGTQWILPHRKDRAYLTVTVAAASFNVVLAIVLVPHLEQVGMAAATLLAETVSAIVLWRVATRLGPARSSTR